MTNGVGRQLEVGIHEGDVLAGKYRVERILGAGGMGIVVAAFHVDLGKQVAIKLMRSEIARDSAAVGRFLREARAVVRIESEYVGRAIDVGTLPNGAPYMVMEFLEGSDLGAWLKDRGPLPVEQAVDFVLQACVGTAEAHRLGIVHRDLKPSNLFCVRRSDGQLIIKVLDFGISKVTDSVASGMSGTKTGSVMGSPLYMSPEQMRSSKDVDVQTDIWALGVILFELLTGRTPFTGDTLPEVTVQVVTEPAPPIRNFRPDVPRGLDTAIQRCLEKDRRVRYRSVAELALAILAFGPEHAKASAARISGILRTGAPSASAPELLAAPLPGGRTLLAPETVPPVGRTATSPTHGKTSALIFGGMALATIAGSAIWLTHGSARRESLQAGEVSPPHLATSALTTVESATPIATAALAPMPTPTATTTTTTTTTQAGSVVVQKSDAAKKKVPPTGLPAAAKSGAPPASRAPSVSAPPAIQCDPPFFFDAKGNRVFKPECL